MTKSYRITLIYLCLLTIGIVLLSSWPTAAQTISEFAIPTVNAQPEAIVAGPDGALWFTEVNSNKIGRITTAGSISEFLLPTSSFPQGIAAGPDGALWFTEYCCGGSSFRLGRITTGGSVTEFNLPTPGYSAGSIVAGPDGALWFTEGNGNNGSKIGRITTSGAITEFPLPSGGMVIGNAETDAITVGPDGALWFMGLGLGRITTAGVITELVPQNVALRCSDGIAVGSDGAFWFNCGNGIGRGTTNGTFSIFPANYPFTLIDNTDAIVSGPDGALWFTQLNSIGRITTAGSFSSFPLPGSQLRGNIGIAVGSDGALWFTEINGNNIGRISVGSAANTLVSAVLPSSRSIMVGGTATAFATMINSGTTAATGCGIVPTTSVPASFTYQTTDPTTNAVTGSANTPASIAGGGSQSFVIALAATAAMAPTTVAFGFDCSGLSAAVSNPGLNTLLFSASATPVPDIVALGATASNDGTLHITGANGSGAFAVATVNLGAAAQITASANTGSATLPLTLNLCQTNPTSGQCISAIGPSVTTTIGANATPTFAIFGTASGAIAFLPAASRIFVQFADSNGNIHGSTSVAVETQ